MKTKEMDYKQKSRQIVNYKVARRYKKGNILLSQKTKVGLTGYDNTDDYNRIMLYPKTGYYAQHTFCSQINLGNIWFEGIEYQFGGEY